MTCGKRWGLQKQGDEFNKRLFCFAGLVLLHGYTHLTKFVGPIWGPPGSCRPQMGPMMNLATRVAIIQSTSLKRPKNGKFIRVVDLVVTGKVEACLKRLQWRARQSPWRPIRFSGPSVRSHFVVRLYNSSYNGFKEQFIDLRYYTRCIALWYHSAVMNVYLFNGVYAYIYIYISYS